MKKGDRIFAVICLALSAWLILESMNYDYMSTYTPGPGFHPFWLGICLGALSVYLMFDTFRRKPTKEDRQSQLPEKKALMRVGLILLITAALAVVMTQAGFVLGCFIFIAVTLVVLEKFTIRKGLFYSAAFSAGIFLIFRYWLEVDLPRGWLGL